MLSLFGCYLFRNWTRHLSCINLCWIYEMCSLRFTQSHLFLLLLLLLSFRSLLRFISRICSILLVVELLHVDIRIEIYVRIFVVDNCHWLIGLVSNRWTVNSLWVDNRLWILAFKNVVCNCLFAVVQVTDFDRNQLLFSLGGWLTETRSSSSFLFISKRWVLSRNIFWYQTWILRFELLLHLPDSSLIITGILWIIIFLTLKAIMRSRSLLLPLFLISFILNKLINPG